jgi:hypothetical protein
MLFEILLVLGNIPMCLCLLFPVSPYHCSNTVFLLLYSERVFEPVQCLCRRSCGHDVTPPLDCDVTFSSSVISVNYHNVTSLIHIGYLGHNIDFIPF